MKILNIIIFLFLAVTLSGCLDKLPEEGSDNFCPGIRLADGACPFGEAKIWNFNIAGSYSYNTNYVEISSGAATLKSVDQLHSGVEFNMGTHAGTGLNSENDLTLLTKFHDSLNVKNILPTRSSSLVGYWRLDHNGDDSSGNNLNSALYGGTTFDSGSKIGSGAISYSVNPTGARTTNFPDLSNQLSISLWVNINLHRDYRRILSKGLDDSNIDFQIISNTSGLYNFASSACSSGFNQAIPINSWVHFMVTIDGSKFKIYQNGIKTHDSNCSGSFVNKGSHLNIGSNQNGYSSVDGKVDDVAVWNVGLSDPEVQKIYRLQKQDYTELSSDWTPEFSEIVGYWKMDGNWLDSSVSDNHFDDTGTETTFSNDLKIGDSSLYISESIVDNNNAKLSTLNVNTGDFSNGFTIASWIKIKNTSGWHEIFRKGDGSNINFRLLYFSNSYRCSFTNTTAKTVISPSTDKYVDQWTHVLCSYDSINEKLSIYINGVLSGAESTSGVVPDSLSYILKLTDGSFRGGIDDLALWKKGISDSDAKIIYNRQKQKYAGHYDSQIIDLGTSSDWSNLQVKTALPFMKELSLGTESSVNYSKIGFDFSTNLISYWPMNLDYNDHSGSSYHLTPINTPDLSASGVLDTGVSGTGNNSGSNQYFMGSSDVLSSRTAFTISSWVKSFAISSGTLISDSYSTDPSAKISINSSGDITYSHYDGATTHSISTSSAPLERGKYSLVTVTRANNQKDISIYVNGVLITSATLSAVPSSPSSPTLRVLARKGNGEQFIGSIDDMAVWSREFTSDEVKELYRRGANRLKYQVRSCDDAACDAETFLGPDGTTGTYFSELHNNSIIDGSGKPIGSVLATFPNFTFSEFITAPSNNRYFQYRIYLESDENNLCSGLPCMPEVKSVEVGPTGRYFGGNPSITTKNGLVYNKMNKITFFESGSCQVEHQLSNDGSNYYFWNGSTWASVLSDLDRNNKAVVSNNIKKFSTQLGPGTLYLRSFLPSNTTQSCVLKEVSIESLK